MEAKKRVLVVSAHAADFCSRAGGTIAKYASAGSFVRILGLTFGEQGESADFWRANPGASIEDAKTTRKEESSRAAAILGAEIRFKDWGDYPLIIGKERLIELADEIRDAAPDIILTHWPKAPFNQDHAYATDAVIRACGLANAAGLKTDHPPRRWPAIYFFEAGVPWTEFEEFRPDTYIDITEVFDQKLRALRELKSQQQLPEWYTNYALQRGLQARSFSGNMEIKHAEAFARYRGWVGQYFP
ncbi:MAG: PIG-L family deacetylase [Bacteroidetes bacterium]|nr:PIG-L family deacetylase [Bacteroidota bacterium]